MNRDELESKIETGQTGLNLFWLVWDSTAVVAIGGVMMYKLLR